MMKSSTAGQQVYVPCSSRRTMAGLRGTWHVALQHWPGGVQESAHTALLRHYRRPSGAKKRKLVAKGTQPLGRVVHCGSQQKSR